MSNLEFHKDSFKFEVEGVSMRILSKDEVKQFESKDVIRFDNYNSQTNKWTRTK